MIAAISVKDKANASCSTNAMRSAGSANEASAVYARALEAKVVYVLRFGDLPDNPESPLPPEKKKPILAKVGSETRFRLNASPLREIQDWAAFYSKFWQANMLRLNQFFEEEQQ